MSLWTATEAAAATGGQAKGDWSVSGVSIDTRTLEPGDLFIALKAARDGHEFVAQALEKGAGAAMVTHIPDGVAADAPLLIVEDIQTALEALGRAGRARTTARVVAVTGSVGKTTTKEMLALMLGDQGRTHASVASYNNHWGVPLTLARMPRDTEFAVIEIGMNHPGEIAPLARMARPHVAMVTTVGPAHLEAFGAIEGIAREKASIVEGLEPNGVAVLNCDIETAPILRDIALKSGARVVSFGQTAQAHHRISRIETGVDSTVAEARAWRTPMLVKVTAQGAHFVQNAVGALACVWALGGDRARALISLASWSAVAGRGAREPIVMDLVDQNAVIELIDDAYNANPASVAASLTVLASADVQNGVGRISKGRRIAVLGDMKELGPQEHNLHAGIADLAAIADLDRVDCVGPLMRALYEALPEDKRGLWTEDSDTMAKLITRRLDSGDVVLVKGSLSMRMALIVDAIRKMGHPARTEEE